MRVYVGLDWSAREVVAAVGESTGNPIAFGKFSKNLDAAEKFLKRVRAEFDATEIRVGIEAGAPGWVALLDAAGADVFVLDPKQVKRFGETLGSSGAKDDKRDAKTVVEFLRSPVHEHQVWQPPSTLQRVVEIVLSEREQAIKERTATLQRIRQHLRELLPQVDAVLPSSFGKWVVALLRLVSTSEQADALSREQFEAVMHSYGARMRTRDRVWNAIKQRRPKLCPEVAKRLTGRMHRLLDRLDLLNHQIAQLDADLDATTRDSQLRQMFQSIKGIGPQLAIGLLSLGFDPEDQRDRVAIKMGAAPVYRGSAKRGSTQMRRAAKSRHKAMAYLLGRLASQQLGWAKAMYADGRARGQTAAHAYRRIARSLLRILQAMVRNKTEYDEEHYIQQLKRNGVSWAAKL